MIFQFSGWNVYNKPETTEKSSTTFPWVLQANRCATQRKCMYLIAVCGTGTHSYLSRRGEMVYWETQVFKNKSVQFCSVVQWCPTLSKPMNLSTPSLPVHHNLPEFTQTQVHRVGNAIQPSHPLSSPSPPAPNPSQHQTLFQWVNSSHEVAKLY